jgi:Zn-dependent peptidase ImmA (M78 family)/transcriptional regulator with XRE-family HTH domain
MTGVGEMLRLARQRLGLTQKAAAAKLGIPQPVLSRYENGVSDPEAALLLKAARVYDLPRTFFDLRDPVYGPPVSVHPMPRAKADVTARDLDIVTAELNIRVMQMRRFLESVDFEPTNELPKLDIEAYETPSNIAEIVRSHWKVPSGPIRNLTRLAERAGVVVGTSEFGGASISGMTFKVPGQPPLVLLNAHHPADRLRFTLAHELGHLVMHRFPTPTMEDEANDFASALLMPTADISEVLRGRRITLEFLAALKPEWRVAMQAVAMRAKKLGFLNENQARYIFQQISARGWRTREPSELDFPIETPTVMRAIIRNHVDVLGFSLRDLCNLVPVHEREFLRMYGPIDDQEPPRPRLRLVT